MVIALGFAGLLGLLAFPVALWHSEIGDVLASFHWSFTYFISELSPWLLMLAAVAFLVPVAVSAGRGPQRRLFPHVRRTYVAWGTVLYLLGCILAVQVAAIWSYAH